MAVDTPKTLRGQVIYSIFPRNFSEAGTFAAIEPELDRIKALGTDIIWLMPIHPIGAVNRKGSLGSPYAIQDYREINPEYGTKADFIHLTEAIHARGMKVIIDVVYNHTSPDSWLIQHHPEWFYHKPNGDFGNKTGDWTDVKDLDYSLNHDLWDYQIETLQMWAEFVDGFRCDVASLVPLNFWLEARQGVAKVRPDAIWLSESVEESFVSYNRSQGQTALSESEIFQAFDMAYDYDVFEVFNGVLTGKRNLADYAEALARQTVIYPDNYIKMRYLENHDNFRAAALIPDPEKLATWTAFMYFQQGTTQLYAGQEVHAKHIPSLFDADKVEWQTGLDQSDYLARLAEITSAEIFKTGYYTIEADGQALIGKYVLGAEEIVGLFPVQGIGIAHLNGKYEDLLTGDIVQSNNGKVAFHQAMILKEV